MEIFQKSSNKLKNLTYSSLTSLVSCSNSDRKKVENAMRLVEALLTYDDRQAFISGALSTHDAAAKFASLDQWIVRATAAFNNTVVTKKRKSSILGVGNVVGKNLNLVSKYIPDWNAVNGDPAYAPRQRQTLRDWITSKENERQPKK